MIKKGGVTSPVQRTMKELESDRRKLKTTTEKNETFNRTGDVAAEEGWEEEEGEEEDAGP